MYCCVAGARTAVFEVFVNGASIDFNNPWPSRQECQRMTGYDGDSGGPWQTKRSWNLSPGRKGVTDLHPVQVVFLQSADLMTYDGEFCLLCVAVCVCMRLVQVRV